MDNQIPEKTKRRAFTVSWIKKNLNALREINELAHTCKCQINNSVRANSLKREVMNYGQKYFEIVILLLYYGKENFLLVGTIIFGLNLSLDINCVRTSNIVINERMIDWKIYWLIR